MLLLQHQGASAIHAHCGSGGLCKVQRPTLARLGAYFFTHEGGLAPSLIFHFVVQGSSHRRRRRQHRKKGKEKVLLFGFLQATCMHYLQPWSLCIVA